MGCFSYLCQICGKPINSDSERGQMCNLFLLRNGKVVEAMEGEYDSYGRVFDEEGNSIKWNTPWNDVVDLHFSSNIGNGIAAFHHNCFKGINQIPSQRSQDDPEQGWGSFYKQKTPFKGGKKIDIIKSIPELKEIYKPTEEELQYQKTFVELQQKFQSGNSIPVTMTSITRKEWEVIFPVLQKHYMNTLFMPEGEIG